MPEVPASSLGIIKKNICIHRIVLESTPFYFSAVSLAGLISGPGIICGPIWGEFAVRMRAGIICGPEFLTCLLK